MTQGDKLYNAAFYQGQSEESYHSAKAYFAILHEYIRPQSVIDIGCGVGTWLKAAHEKGAQTLIGIDGPWNSQEAMCTPSIAFIPTDLNLPFVPLVKQRFDLAMSLEVAEHLEEKSASAFVTNLCALSDAVLFSAAIPGQGGTGHINEQWQSYWATFFAAEGYDVFDLFRSHVWGNTSVALCYQQNTFLYAKKDTIIYNTLLAKGLKPLANLHSLDMVHPTRYCYYANKLLKQKYKHPKNIIKRALFPLERKSTQKLIQYESMLKRY